MKSKRNKWRILLLSGLLLLIASAAEAQSCDVTTSSVSFGAYNIFRTISLDSTGTIAVTCTANTHYHVELGPGMHPASQSPFRPRYMHRIGGMGRLKYQLYTNSARTLVWGDGIHSNTDICTETTCVATQTTSRVGTENLTTRRFEVFGRVELRQNVYSGSYKDVVTVTVRY